MKYTNTVLSLLTLLSTSTAQSLSDVPACASQAALNSFTNSGCPLTDAACICKNPNYLSSLLPVVRAACSPEELQNGLHYPTGTVEFTRKFCADAGVNLQITTSASSSAATETPTSTLAAPGATASNGTTLNPGNSTVGGAPQPANPTPQSPPISGVAGLVGLAKNGGILGVVIVGAVMVL
ncbi:MAG: hypothetical protein Q9213_003269 [Squamulea squamosa]